MAVEININFIGYISFFWSNKSSEWNSDKNTYNENKRLYQILRIFFAFSLCAKLIVNFPQNNLELNLTSCFQFFRVCFNQIKAHIELIDDRHNFFLNLSWTKMMFNLCKIKITATRAFEMINLHKYLTQLSLYLSHHGISWIFSEMKG